MAKTTGYATGNDSFESRSATGSASGGGAEPDETDEVLTPASLLDEKVIELIQSAGVNFNYKTAAEGTMKKIVVDDELAAALLRLEKAAPLLNAAVALSARRAASGSPLARLLGKARPTSYNNSADAVREYKEEGSASGSESGSDSGDVSKLLIVSHMLRSVAGGRASVSGSESGSTSGSESGSASGSQSGEMSKTLFERFLAGDRESGLKLMGLR